LQIIAVVVVLIAALLNSLPADAQEGNYAPTDPSTLPQIPGCDWYPSAVYPGTYEIWCGSDTLG